MERAARKAIGGSVEVWGLAAANCGRSVVTLNALRNVDERECENEGEGER